MRLGIQKDVGKIAKGNLNWHDASATSHIRGLKRV